MMRRSKRSMIAAEKWLEKVRMLSHYGESTPDANAEDLQSDTLLTPIVNPFTPAIAHEPKRLIKLTSCAMPRDGFTMIRKTGLGSFMPLWVATL